MPPNREILPPDHGLQRTISDISTDLTRIVTIELPHEMTKLPPIPEIEDAKCECCGMSEECTPGYISRVRANFLGKLVCGLCSEAVRELGKKKGGSMEEALEEHTNACLRFNRVVRAYPVLLQAEAMKEILKKRGKSIINPREKKVIGRITRSSSCIPEIASRGLVN